MRYCVVKGTTKVINSHNPVESMLQDAQNAGFSEEEVEILTEEEFQVRVDAEPKPPQPLSDIDQLRLEQAQANSELVQLIMAMSGGM